MSQKLLFALENPNALTQISGKNAHLTLKVCSIKKFILNIDETVFKSTF